MKFVYSLITIQGLFAFFAIVFVQNDLNHPLATNATESWIFIIGCSVSLTIPILVILIDLLTNKFTRKAKFISMIITISLTVLTSSLFIIMLDAVLSRMH